MYCPSAPSAMVRSSANLLRTMSAIQYVLSKYPVKKGAVIAMLSRLQHGEDKGVPLIDKAALYIVGGYMMVCYDLPSKDSDAGDDAVVRHLWTRWACGKKCTSCLREHFLCS
jgi:formylmethanofuran dehydrogenase subunit A